jgi:hypothetical protein
VYGPIDVGEAAPGVLVGFDIGSGIEWHSAPVTWSAARIDVRQIASRRISGLFRRRDFFVDA